MRCLRPSDAFRPINWAIDRVACWVTGRLWNPDYIWGEETLEEILKGKDKS